MKLALIIFLIFTIASLLSFCSHFAMWGNHFDTLFNQQACAQWFEEIQAWAWIVGIGLLISDLVLPIPATGIMAALGSVYGVWLGGFIAAAGSAGAGFSGYGLARLAGRKGVRWLANDAELARFKAFFDRWGGWGVIVSRILPILPEVMTILAGLAHMDLKKFSAALLLGTIPTCFLFAYLGHASRTDPGYGIAAAVVLPLLLWPVFLLFIKKPRAEKGQHVQFEKRSGVI
jgi:uncharacterized membrane protein YdjX (TVP38/TMEM64 family)